MNSPVRTCPQIGPLSLWERTCAQIGPLSLWERVRVRARRRQHSVRFSVFSERPSPPAPLPKGEGSFSRHARRTPRCSIWLFAIASCACLSAALPLPRAFAAEPGDELVRGFVSPPDAAKPQTWWHWMNGNVTREGITADLEAMQRVGIGGAQVFNPLEGIPDGPAPYRAPNGSTCCILPRRKRIALA